MRLMLQKLATHIWPKDQPALRFRVVVAMSLLIGAKVSLSAVFILSEFSKKKSRNCKSGLTDNDKFSLTNYSSIYEGRSKSFATRP